MFVKTVILWLVSLHEISISWCCKLGVLYRYGGPGGMTPQSMMAISQQQQEFAASQQASAEASRSQAIFHAQQQQMEANMRAQQFHGGTMPNGPPTTMGPQTVNNTYVNAKIAIEHVNIQNMPSGTTQHSKQSRVKFLHSFSVVGFLSRYP